jgi:uncharacterized protein YihD (DUF1040 family)
MDLNVIAGKKLLKRWHMKEPDLLLMKLNQKLATVHRETGEEGWLEDPEDDFMRMVVQEKQAISSFTFRIQDVLDLEAKHPDLLSRSRRMMSGNNLMKRWGLAGDELLDILADQRLEAADSVGASLDFSDIELLLSAGCIDVADLLFKLDAVEHFEKKHGVKPKSKTLGMPKEPKPRYSD